MSNFNIGDVVGIKGDDTQFVIISYHNVYTQNGYVPKAVLLSLNGTKVKLLETALFLVEENDITKELKILQYITRYKEDVINTNNFTTSDKDAILQRTFEILVA